MEIIAALIIACSNLSSNPTSAHGHKSEVDKKVACIQRVSVCGDKVLGKLAQHSAALNKCSKEVYL